MDSVERIEAAILAVEEARSVPLSASCVVHRGEMLDLLEKIKQSFPNDLNKAIRSTLHSIMWLLWATRCLTLYS